MNNAEALMNVVLMLFGRTGCTKSEIESGLLKMEDSMI